MFQHFIITRFNLRKQEWQTTREKTQVLTDAWMDNRIRLFEHYCYSSVRAQSQKDFTWLVYFDIQTPKKYQARIKELADLFSAFKPQFIDGMEAFLPSIKNDISALLTQPYLITSRLDNDDSLHEDYIAEIQSHFNHQEFMAIDIIDGLTLQIEPEVKFGRRRHVNNPFISLIEKAQNFETVWSRERHGEWKRVKEVMIIQDKPLWMSIIHSENKANDFLGFGKKTWDAITPFHINAKLSQKLKSKQTQKWKIQALKNQLKTQWKVFFKLLHRRITHF